MRRSSSPSQSGSGDSGSGQDSKAKKGSGSYYRHDSHGMYGTVSGGGPTMRFETFNGSIYIRKGK